MRFFDLGGHERYSKTMLHGLTTLLPDCVLLCVSATAGAGAGLAQWMFWGCRLPIPETVGLRVVGCGMHPPCLCDPPEQN